MKIEVCGIIHPHWTKLFLRINSKEFASQILEELQKRYPYFSLNYIEKILKKFLIENKELSNYIDLPVIDISFNCDKSEVNILAHKIKDNFKKMLKYLNEKHDLVTLILEDKEIVMDNNIQNSLKILCPFRGKLCMSKTLHPPESINTENYTKTIEINCKHCNRVVYVKETNVSNE